MDIPTLTPGIIACRAVLHDFDEEHCDGSNPEMRAALVAQLVEEVMLLTRDDAERAAVRMVPRPGTWFGDEGADGRWLTQAQTDHLIRHELVRQLVGMGPRMAGTPRDDDMNRLMAALDIHEQDVRSPIRVEETAASMGGIATNQRGGISSDPVDRLLAHRVWGERDARWFEDRGIRVGDRVTVVERDIVACAWEHGAAFAGIALTDAWPGQRPKIDGNGLDGSGWPVTYGNGKTQIVSLTVSARLRPPLGDVPPGIRAPTLAQQIARREYYRAKASSRPLGITVPATDLEPRSDEWLPDVLDKDGAMRRTRPGG